MREGKRSSICFPPTRSHTHTSGLNGQRWVWNTSPRWPTWVVVEQSCQQPLILLHPSPDEHLLDAAPPVVLGAHRLGAPLGVSPAAKSSRCHPQKVLHRTHLARYSL